MVGAHSLFHALLVSPTGPCAFEAEDALHECIAVRAARFVSVSILLSESKTHSPVGLTNNACDIMLFIKEAKLERRHTGLVSRQEMICLIYMYHISTVHPLASVVKSTHIRMLLPASSCIYALITLFPRTGVA